MLVLDQIYGAINLPSWLEPILHAAEVQRLHDVRLVNIPSQAYPALSDVRRLSHTIGVTYLATRLRRKVADKWSDDHARALIVAALIHDVGTPAFGHLIEYPLAAVKGWNHERYVRNVIRGNYHPEKRYHQIYYSNPLSLHERLKKLRIDIELVISLICGESPLGKLLAGDLDIDNIDNVFRMAAMLGFSNSNSIPVCLVDGIDLERDGSIFGEATLPFVEAWQDLRYREYEILAFDEPSLSGQAMLTDCLSYALQEDLFGEEQWFFTDDMILSHFLEMSETRDVIRRFAVGDVYDTVFLGWYNTGKGEKDLRDPRHRAEFAKILSDGIGIPCSPYVFYDEGTFSKKLELVVRPNESSPQARVLGKKSISVVVGVFTPRRFSRSQRVKFSDPILNLLEKYGLYRTGLTAIPTKEEIYGVPRQERLPF